MMFKVKKKSEINILQIEWKTKFFFCKIKRKTSFDLINFSRRVKTSNKNSPPVVTCNADCGVIFYLCRRIVVDLVVSLQVIT